MTNKPFFVYIVKCSDATYYTGYTDDVEKRIITHNTSDKGAKYTKGRRPVTLMYQEMCATKGDAMSLEYKLKSLSRKQKEVLIRGAHIAVRRT